MCGGRQKRITSFSRARLITSRVMWLACSSTNNSTGDALAEEDLPHPHQEQFAVGPTRFAFCVHCIIRSQIGTQPPRKASFCQKCWPKVHFVLLPIEKNSCCRHRITLEAVDPTQSNVQRRNKYQMNTRCLLYRCACVRRSSSRNFIATLRMAIFCPGS